MKLLSAGSRPALRGNPAYFTGVVWIDELTGPETSGRLCAFRVSFEPGARTAWHTHPHGQMLYLLAGIGRAQREGGPLVELLSGDTVWIAAGERHWHGAAPGHTMVHLALQEADAAGCHAHWQRQVTDEEYHAHLVP